MRRLVSHDRRDGMKLFTSLDQLPADFHAGAVTIGNFDGVHRGHARIIQRLMERAREFSGPAVVFTFEPHPVRLLRPEAAPAPLTWVDRKASLLSDLDVDVLIAYPVDMAFLSLSPEAYFEGIIQQKLRARALVEGPNFYFGKNRAGDIACLRSLCAKHEVSLDVVDPLQLDGSYVSSSRVRSAIADGDVDLANEMLTQPYRVRGMITHGAGRGRELGVPTANVAAVDTLLPGVGVYAGRAYVNGHAWPAAVNIGSNPTFGDSQFKVEVHLIGFSGSLYGNPLEVDFVTRLRDIHQFANLTELQAQLHADIEQARRIITKE